MTKWKIVFFIAVFFLIKDIWQEYSYESISLLSFSQIMLSGFSLLSIYGYAYQKAVGSRFFAKTIFYLNACTCLFITYLLINGVISHLSIIQFVASSIGMLVLIIYITPIYLYTFKSNHLWESNA